VAPAGTGGSGTAATTTPGGYTDVDVTGIRKTIATRMHASLQESAQLTLQRRADARALQAYRARVKEERRRAETAGRTGGPPNITINHMVLFAVARVLPRFPEMNAHFLGDTIRRFEGVDLGFAVDTPKGLLVPTIRRADAKSLTAITEESGALAERALAGRATADDLAPATFTVTNLGGLGIEWFTPVLNTPQVGILGVGAPVPGYNEDGEAIPQIGLSLTIDHRAVDGAPGARFLAEVARSIATFELTLAQ
jgi:pyruvate dehydrogenase E2 component (dihydrolipoamide acetyltransferase)